MLISTLHNNYIDERGGLISKFKKSNFVSREAFETSNEIGMFKVLFSSLGRFCRSMMS